MAVQEIADSAGDTPAAVRKRLSRAVAALRGRLDRDFGEARDHALRALAAFAFAPGGRAGAAGIGNIAGGALVSKTTLTIGVAASAAALGLAAWLLVRSGPSEAARPAANAPALVELAPAEPAVEGRAGSANLEREGAAPRPRSPADPGPAGALYALRDADGAPLAGARVVLCAAGEVLASGVTDDAGELATGEDREGSGKLLVLARGSAPRAPEVSMERGRHEVVLERGAAVAGRILVNGAPPSERIPLVLLSHKSLFSIEEELGLAWDALDAPPNPGRTIRMRAEIDGSFRFQRLSGDWEGELVLPVDYPLADPSLAASAYSPNRVELDAPEEDLRIETTKRLALTGRIVELPAREPTPVAGAVVLPQLQYSPEPPASVLAWQVRADDEGRFRIALASPSVFGGELSIGGADGTYVREIALEPREVAEDWDLGDLALADPEAQRSVALVVLDADARPVAGAIAASGPAAPISAPTDGAGRATLRGVVPGVSTIAVYAAGYEVARVALPAADPPGRPAAELEVVLRRGTLLEIRFLQPDGEPAPKLVARLSAARHPYRDEERPRSYPAYTRAGCSFYEVVPLAGGEVAVRVHALREGRVTLNDLEPHLPLRLRVEGSLGSTIQEQDIAPLAPEEHRAIEVVLARAPRTLRGRVMDEAGVPLPRATVGIRWTPPDSPNGTTALTRGFEDDGGFELGNVYEPEVFLSVEANGSVPVWNERFEVPVDGAPLEFRLSPSRVVEVTVEDEAGMRLPAFVHAELPTGALVFGQEVEGETGVYLLRGLPRGEVAVTASVYGAPHTRTCDATEPRLVIRVPVLGEVRAKVHVFGDTGVDDSWVVCLVPAPGATLAEVYATIDPGGRDESVFPGVVPGGYEAVVRRYPDGFAALDRFEERSPRVTVEVRAGEISRIELWP